MLLSIFFPLRSHFDASVRQTETSGGELFEKFQQKQKIIKDNIVTEGNQMGGKRLGVKLNNSEILPQPVFMLQFD